MITRIKKEPVDITLIGSLSLRRTFSPDLFISIIVHHTTMQPERSKVSSFFACLYLGDIPFGRSPGRPSAKLLLFILKLSYVVQFHAMIPNSSSFFHIPPHLSSTFSNIYYLFSITPITHTTQNITKDDAETLKPQHLQQLCQMI